MFLNKLVVLLGIVLSLNTQAVNANSIFPLWKSWRMTGHQAIRVTNHAWFLSDVVIKVAVNSPSGIKVICGDGTHYESIQPNQTVTCHTYLNETTTWYSLDNPGSHGSYHLYNFMK